MTSQRGTSATAETDDAGTTASWLKAVWGDLAFPHFTPARTVICRFAATLVFSAQVSGQSVRFVPIPRLLVLAITAACCVSDVCPQLVNAGGATATVTPTSAIDSRGDAWQPGTVMPSAPSSDSSTGNDFEMELVDSSTPSPTPPPRAPADSTTFRLVPTMPCNQTVAATTVQVYTKNRALFEECVGKAKYQIFPFSGVLPTPAQITMQAIVPACAAIFTGILLLGIPQCDVGSMPLKSVSETLLKVTVDIRSGLPCPDPQQFFNLIVWRRDSNLAQDAGLPYDSGSELYAEYTRSLWKSLTTYNVRVGSDLTIRYDGDGLDGDTSGSTSDAIGASKVGSTSSQPASTPSLSPRAGMSEATTSTSSGATTIFEPRTAAFMTGIVVAVLARSVWS